MSAAGATILLVDDHSVVREGYRSVLQKQPGLRVIAEAADGAEAYRLYKSEAPDLVIMDLSMPGIGGIEAVRRIRQWDKGARILVFTMHENAGFAVQAIRAGARGYVTKTSPPETLVRAVMDVLAGKIAISPDIDHELALSRLAGESSAADVLTPREFEVLRLLLAENTTEGDRRDAPCQPEDGGEPAFPDQGQARRRIRHRAGPAGAAPGHLDGGRSRRGLIAQAR
ncbi:two-component system invasion response regulator UvrY [Bradyrhizobium sp. GM2.4]